MPPLFLIHRGGSDPVGGAFCMPSRCNLHTPAILARNHHALRMLKFCFTQ